jgi:hypothetical protein
MDEGPPCDSVCSGSTLVLACTPAFVGGAPGAKTPVNLASVAEYPGRFPMDKSALRVLIQLKLNDGRLPNNSIPRVWGGPGHGETCLACDEIVLQGQLLMEGISFDASSGVHFHVQCFYLWDTLRKAEGHQASGPA